MTEVFIDPYLDPETQTLRNLLGIQSQDDLDEAEREISFSNELKIDMVPHTRDFMELLAIHKILFQDIYDWAGEVRNVDIHKLGHEFFLTWPKISTGAEYIFNELAKQNYLTGLSRESFVKQLAYFYEQLNFIHPFREGNGRTQRIFWNRVAADAGYVIDWSLVVGNELNLASIAGHEQNDLSLLENMFDRIVRLP